MSLYGKFILLKCFFVNYTQTHVMNNAYVSASRNKLRLRLNVNMYNNNKFEKKEEETLLTTTTIIFQKIIIGH